MGKYLDSALLVAKKRNISEESSVFATYYSYASDYYQKIRNDKKAYEALVKILNIDKAAYGKDSANFTIDYLASDYNNLGLYYKTKGDYEEARTYYKQALSFYSKENTKSKVKTYNNIAETYKAEEAIERALITYQEALSLAVSEENKESLALIYNNLADTYSAIQPDSALHFLQLLKPLLSQNAKIDRANYHQILADTKRYEKAYEAAEKNMLKALQLRKAVFKHNHPTIALGYRNLGMLYAQQNQHEKALRNYQLALANVVHEFKDTISYTSNPSLEEQINDRLELLSIFKKKAQSLHATKKLGVSKSTLQLAIQLIDQIRYNYLAEGSKYALLERAMPIYEQAIDLALEMDELEWAFEVAERSKATLLLESIKNSEAQTFAGISEELLGQEREMKVQIAFYERLLNQEEVQPNYQRELFDLRQNYQAFLEELEQNHPEYYELKYELDYPSVSELQSQLLDEQTALLEYFTGDSSIYLFVLTKDDLQVQKLEKTTEFEENLSQLRSSLSEVSGNSFADFTSSAYHIYSNYLQRNLEKLPHEINQLLLIPDGQLNYIPFQSLIQKPVNQSNIIDPRFDTLSYLVYDYTLSYAYSSTLLLKKRANKQERELTFGGFAPIFSGNTTIPERNNRKYLSELPFSRTEIENIHALFGGQNYLQNAASLANFKNQAANFIILHLSTHAAVEDKNPARSRIYFYDDYLTVNEIYNLPIQADLTVLSACETGIGEYKKGEGMLSLARAFMYAGCPSLVTSLWQVNDEKTADLMLNFYEQLLQKKSKDQALQQAQINYLRTASMEAAHPFYWAAFVQVGDREAIVRSGSSWIWWLVLGIISMVLLGFYWKKKPV